jgi:antitoxin ParD1/3/4
MAQMNLSIPDNLKKWVESRVADGSYASSSDYVRDLIRQEQRYREKLARLKAEIDAGFDSPISKRSVKQVMADALAKIPSDSQIDNAA